MQEKEELRIHTSAVTRVKVERKILWVGIRFEWQLNCRIDDLETKPGNNNSVSCLFLRSTVHIDLQKQLKKKEIRRDRKALLKVY